METISMFDNRSWTIIAVLCAVSFLCGLVFGLPILGWWLFPVEWEAEPLPTYTPYPTYTPLAIAEGGGIPAQASPTLPPPTLPAATNPATLPPTSLPDAFYGGDALVLRRGPDKSYLEEIKLQGPINLEVIGENDGCRWLKVATGGGESGWVRQNTNGLTVHLDCASIPPGTFRPQTGWVIWPRLTGEGELTVDNGTTQDGLVILSPVGDEDNPLGAAYVRAGKSFTLGGIPDGEYILFYSTGSEWNGDAGTFTAEPRYQRFDETLLFNTTLSTYTIWSLTLHPVVGGTAATSSVPVEDFPVLDGLGNGEN
jgi:hypothetical protein